MDKLFSASSPKANEPKKKRPEMKNFVHPYARYTCLIALPSGQNFAPFGFAELAIASPDLKYELLCALGSGLPWRHFV